LPTSVQSLEPYLLELLPDDAGDFMVYIQNVAAGWEGTTESLISFTTENGTDPDYGDFVRLNCSYQLQNISNLRSLFDVSVSYTMTNETFMVKPTINYLQNSSDHFEIGFYQKYRWDQWIKEYYPDMHGSVSLVLMAPAIDTY